jgi:hypothetical protein
MSDTTTTLYGITQPQVGSSSGTWGGKLNTDLSSIDALLGVFLTTGSSNTYAVSTGLSLNTAPGVYVGGQTFRIKPNFTNTGAATINFDTLGAVAVTKNGTTALTGGELVSGTVYQLSYDGTQFQIVGPSLAAYQPASAFLTALAALGSTPSAYLRCTGSNAFAWDSYSTVLSNINAQTALGFTPTNPSTYNAGVRNITIQSGGSASGGSNGDLFFIY